MARLGMRGLLEEAEKLLHAPKCERCCFISRVHVSQDMLPHSPLQGQAGTQTDRQTARTVLDGCLNQLRGRRGSAGRGVGMAVAAAALAQLVAIVRANGVRPRNCARQSWQVSLKQISGLQHGESRHAGSVRTGRFWLACL
jgi:hypothetical protein